MQERNSESLINNWCRITSKIVSFYEALDVQVLILKHKMNTQLVHNHRKGVLKTQTKTFLSTIIYEKG